MPIILFFEEQKYSLKFVNNFSAKIFFPANLNNNKFVKKCFPLFKETDEFTRMLGKQKMWIG